MHTILFTGHMIDAIDRPAPRFPATKENAARDEIRNRILKEKERVQDDVTGIAGGACGGDILFLEICRELNIPVEMYLALPAGEFKKNSVSFAGKEWETRFDKLAADLPVHLLPQATGDQSVWERANVWMLETAIANGGENMSLIALWNGKGGDGPGGTQHMVEVAKKQGGTVEIIDINKL